MERSPSRSKAESAIASVLRYHERTKHHVDRYARSLGYLDWATQPNPFRWFDGSPQIPLEHPVPSEHLSYDSLFNEAHAESQPIDYGGISRLFYDSLALSAWKQAPGSQPWSLRVNPSSGCLHPTEGYLIAGPVDGLGDAPSVYHYLPYRHALERRVTLGPEEWESLAEQLPPGNLLVALTSIYWRESWKYGERAFRYCHHDVGHAIGAVAFAAATLGWQVRLIDTVSDEELGWLLGVDRQSGIEAEHPDCMLAVFPHNPEVKGGSVELRLPETLLERIRGAELFGTPNRLSHDHHLWPIIDEVSQATRFTVSSSVSAIERPEAVDLVAQQFSSNLDRQVSARQIIRQRRSAVDMDGRTSLSQEAFYRMLERSLPGARFPFDTLPWRTHVSLALFVHRVEGLSPGLYVLIRHPDHESSLHASIGADFAWTKPPGCPKPLPLWCLVESECRQSAKIISCHQDIAGDGAFSIGMLAQFEHTLRAVGPWLYPRLFWETGLIGQLLYLEPEAAGLAATGIGCFFDDSMHSCLGLRDRNWQSLYHFTVGGAVQDPRLKTLPAYFHLGDHESGQSESSDQDGFRATNNLAPP